MTRGRLRLVQVPGRHVGAARKCSSVAGSRLVAGPFHNRNRCRPVGVTGGDLHVAAVGASVRTVPYVGCCCICVCAWRLGPAVPARCPHGAVAAPVHPVAAGCSARIGPGPWGHRPVDGPATAVGQLDQDDLGALAA